MCLILFCALKTIKGGTAEIALLPDYRAAGTRLKLGIKNALPRLLDSSHRLSCDVQSFFKSSAFPGAIEFLHFRAHADAPKPGLLQV
jgi:hypothetical protein